MLKTNVSEVNSNKFEYTWYLNNEQMSTQQQWVAFPEKESTYIVHIKNGSCKEKVIPVFVNVSPIPSVEAFSDATISLGQSISLTASSDQLVEYTWYPDSNISCLHCFNPVVNPKISTMYKVVGVNEYGCYDDAKVNILVKDFCSGTEFDIPNVFSPNSDGLNDEFKIHYERDLVQIENFRIYNRYGELIFESKDADIGWDGNFNGVPVNSGVYVYYFDADCYHGTKQLYKGNVTLLR